MRVKTHAKIFCMWNQDKLHVIIQLIDATTTQVKHSVCDKDVSLKCLRKAVKSERNARIKLKVHPIFDSLVDSHASRKDGSIFTQ